VLLGKVEVKLTRLPPSLLSTLCGLCETRGGCRGLLQDNHLWWFRPKLLFTSVYQCRHSWCSLKMKFTKNNNTVSGYAKSAKRELKKKCVLRWWQCCGPPPPLQRCFIIASILIPSRDSKNGVPWIIAFILALFKAIFPKSPEGIWCVPDLIIGIGYTHPPPHAHNIVNWLLCESDGMIGGGCVIPFPINIHYTSNKWATDISGPHIPPWRSPQLINIA